MLSQPSNTAECAAVCLLVFSLTGCPKSGSSGGGIQIPPSDATPPEVTLSAGQPGGPSQGVSAVGSAQSLLLTSKTGPLNLIASAKDPESGIQALEIWMTRASTSCSDEDTCSTTGPGNAVRQFESSSPKKNPGESVSASSILAQALDLPTQIPQGAVVAPAKRVVELVFYATAKNHLGGQSNTRFLTITWKEP